MLSVRHLLIKPSFRTSYLSSYEHLRYLNSTAVACQITEEKLPKEQNKTTILYNDVVPKIGLEVHAQLKINSKLFSQGVNSRSEPPNSQLDLFDISLPGTLPKLNGQALRLAIKSALGLNCVVQNKIHFDRKNYFYTDMPAGYQITQYNKPIAKDGYIDFIVTTYHGSLISHSQGYDLTRQLYFDDRKLEEDFEPYIKRSRIKQIQLEQDSAKSLHYENDAQQNLYSLVDYNRSGCALIEIVFEPDLSNHHEASSLVRELVLALKTLDTCDCELEEGSLRVDANVSILSISGEEVRSSGKVELKNLNSIRWINRGISYEIDRQTKLIKEGQTVAQESRTYDTKSHQTVPLRLKEDAIDYRYVPDPNIPPLTIDKKTLGECATDLPQSLPSQLRDRLLSKCDLELLYVAELVGDPGLCSYMLNIMETRSDYDANVIADFLIYTTANLKKIRGSIKVNFDDGSDFMQRLPSDKMQIMIDMVLRDEINWATCYRLIKHIFVSNDISDPREIVKNSDWYQINEPVKVAELCRATIEAMPGLAKKYTKKGEKRHLRPLLVKTCELSDDRINIEKAIQAFNDHLRQS